MTPPLSVQGIVDTASAFYSSAVLFAAIDSGVFTAIAKLGPAAQCARIAEECAASERGARLLLDACVACGLLMKDAAGVYSNTPAGTLALVEGAPSDLSKAIRYNRDVYPAWGRLAELVKTGRPVEKPSMHLGDDPARTKAFAAAMYSRALGIGRGVVPMLALGPGCHKVLDLAGGPAAYAILTAKTFPQVEKIVTLDLPAISKEAASYAAAAGLGPEIECRSGDYHTADFGKEEFDAVTIFGALHQESPESICAILAKAFDALRSGGTIHILDMMTDSTRANPPFSALFAVNMALTMPDGWVFSDDELKRWLAGAGFENTSVQTVPPPMPHWLVSAAKP